MGLLVYLQHDDAECGVTDCDALTPYIVHHKDKSFRVCTEHLEMLQMATSKEYCN